MLRILIGLVALSVAGCSPDQQVTVQERAVQARNDPSEERAGESIPASDSPTVPVEVLLELERGSTDTQIKARIINVGTDPIRITVPNQYWNMKLVWKDPSKINDDLRKSRILDGPLNIVCPADPIWWTGSTAQGRSSTGYIDITDFIYGLGHEDGWYECTMIFDDEVENSMAESMEYGTVSEVGREPFPPIEVHIVDGMAIDWRPVEKH